MGLDHTISCMIFAKNALTIFYSAAEWAKGKPETFHLRLICCGLRWFRDLASLTDLRRALKLEETPEEWNSTTESQTSIQNEGLHLRNSDDLSRYDSSGENLWQEP